MTVVNSNTFRLNVLAAGSVPAYVTNAPAGQWTKIGTNTPQNVRFTGWGTTVNGVVYPNPGTVGSFMQLFGVWTGAAYDPTRKVMYFSGGGHLSYSGNEFYAFHLDTNLWELVNHPSPYGEPVPPPWHPDGTPMALHTYGSNECDDSGRIHILASGAAINTICRYDPNFGSWPITWHGITVPPSPPGPTPWANTGAPVNSGYAGGHFWDSVTSTFYGVNCPSDFCVGHSYKPSTNTSATLPGFPGGFATGYYPGVGFDPSRRLMYIIGGGAAYNPASYGAVRGTVTYNLDTQVWTDMRLQTVGDKAMETNSGMGVVYDDRRDVMWLWDGYPTAKDIFTFKHTTKTYTKITPAGSSPLPAFYQGTYNKFRYIHDYDILVACCGNTDNNTAEMWMYKPNDWMA